MSAGMPELGSKINIITKADIRYEGRLFTVDPEKCTIALANVRSYGTEDRETLAPVPPQNQIYDYILFRGRDIKDIGYVNNSVNTLPNDPAIVQMSCPQTLTSSAYQPTGYSLPVMGPMGTGLSQYASPYSAMGVMPGLTTQVGASLGLGHDPRSLAKQSELVNPVQVSDTSATDDQVSVLDLITGSPRSTTPLLLRKSPTVDQGVQVNQPGAVPGKDDMKQPPARPIQPPSARDGRVVGRSVIGHQPVHLLQQQQQPPMQYQPLPQREDRDHQKLPSMVAPPREQPLHPLERDQHHQMNHQPPGHVALQQRVSHPHQQQHQHQHPHPHPHQQQRGGWVNRGGVRRGRGRSGQNFNRSGPSSGKPKNTLKFEGDYDFEQANTEFDKLMSQLIKTKITVDSDSGSTSDAKVNGDSDKKDDSGHETGTGEGEQEEEHEVYYDKNKSFFDNISCEAVERSKGRSQRTDWRTERKLNSETFGVASARRGGWRGRGFYGNRGMGGMFRSGGYRGGYRGMQGGPRIARIGGFGGQGGAPVQQRPIIAQSK